MLKFYLAIVVILLTSCLLLISSFQSITINNDSWLDADNLLEIQKNYTDDTFYLKPAVSIAVKLDKPLEENINFLKKIQNIRNDFQNNSYLKEFIKEVQTSFDLTQIFTNKQKQLVIKDSFELAKIEKLSFKKILDLNRKNPYTSVFFGKERNILFIKIFTYKKLDFIEQKIFFKEIFNVIDKDKFFFKKYYLTGDIYVNYISNKKTLESLKLISIVAIILIFLFLFYYTQSFVNVLTITVPAFLCFVVSLYLLINLSERVTVISIIIPINIFIIALSDSIHIFFRSFIIDKKNKSSYKLFLVYIKMTFFPCFVTSLTTAIGFMAFCFSDITYLKDFSYISAPIIMINFFIVIITTALLLILNKNNAKSKIQNSFIFSEKIFKYKKIILCVTGVFFLNVFFFYRLEVEGNLLNMFFSENSKFRQDIKFFDDNFYGSMNLSIVVKSDKKNYFKSIKNYQRVTQFIKRISHYPEIKKILSYQDQIQLIHSQLKPLTKHPQNDAELEQELFFLNLSRSDKKLSSLHPYVTFNFAEIRLQIITNQLSIKDNNRLIKKIEQDLQKTFFKEESFVSGTMKIYNAISTYVLETQFRSILISVGVIFFIFLFYFGIKMSLIAMIPNILPLISILSFITFLNIPLDISIVLLVTISFSFCVDNSSHFLHFYNHLSKDKEKSIIMTLNTLIRPFFLAVVILVIGLGSFVFSDLLLLKKFGVFSSITLVIALLCDIFSLPMLIFQFGDKK